MNLILFGFPRSGKTTFGKQLAIERQLSFIDTDALLEERYARTHQEPLTCRQIAEKWGLPFFYTKEEEIISSLKDVENSVIAVGGNAVAKQTTLKLLYTLGLLIYLDIPKNLLKKRLLTPPLPAYLDGSNPEASFEEMYQKRLQIYQGIRASRISPYEANHGE